MSTYDPSNRITYFAESDFRNRKQRFGIKRIDRARHVYVIGKTGMGKSTMLENLAIQDIQNGEGMCFIDPHGGTAEKLLDYVPQDRIKDVLYFAPFDTEYPIAFNVMEDVGPDRRHLVANGLMSAFKKIWVDAWSARMEYILNNTILALLEYPESTLLGVNRMLADKDYRNRVVANISDPSVKSFWVDEFAKYGDRYMQEAGASIQNKVGQFVANPLVRNLIGQPKSTFDIRKMMDERKILIMNLSKGQVGEQNANLIGSMLITKIYLAAMSRANLREEELKQMPHFYLFVDEFQSFANDSFADILSEARKYRLNLTIAHQYIEQMTEMVRAAVFGNVGTTVAFRVGPFDAEVLEKVYAPQFTAEDLVNLGFAQIYLTLMIDGVGSTPFSAVTMAPIQRPPNNYKQQIIENSRIAFAKPRQEVEEFIHDWHAPITAEGGGGGRGNESKPKDGGGEFGSKPKSFGDKPRSSSASGGTSSGHSSSPSAPTSGRPSGSFGGNGDRPKTAGFGARSIGSGQSGGRQASGAPSGRFGADRGVPKPTFAAQGEDRERRRIEPEKRHAEREEGRRVEVRENKPISLSSLGKTSGGQSGGAMDALRDTLKKAMQNSDSSESWRNPPPIDIPAGNESFGDVPTEEEREIPAVVARLKSEVEGGSTNVEDSVESQAEDFTYTAPAHQNVQQQARVTGPSFEDIKNILKVSDEELKAKQKTPHDIQQ